MKCLREVVSKKGEVIHVLGFTLLVGLWILLSLEQVTSHGVHSFSKIGIHQVTFALSDAAYVKASPAILGSKGQNSEWVSVYISNLNPSNDDWIGVFSPANFSDSTCLPENSRVSPPYLCSAPIKFLYANHTNPNYKVTGEASLNLQLFNQRSDFSFALFRKAHVLHYLIDLAT